MVLATVTTQENSASGGDDNHLPARRTSLRTLRMLWAFSVVVMVNHPMNKHRFTAHDVATWHRPISITASYNGGHGVCRRKCTKTRQTRAAEHKRPSRVIILHAVLRHSGTRKTGKPARASDSSGTGRLPCGRWQHVLIPPPRRGKCQPVREWNINPLNTMPA